MSRRQLDLTRSFTESAARAWHHRCCGASSTLEDCPWGKRPSTFRCAGALHEDQKEQQSAISPWASKGADCWGSVTGAVPAAGMDGLYGSCHHRHWGVRGAGNGNPTGGQKGLLCSSGRRGHWETGNDDDRHVSMSLGIIHVPAAAHARLRVLFVVSSGHVQVQGICAPALSSTEAWSFSTPRL